MDDEIPTKGDILTELELDDGVLRLISHARDRGMIPIAGIVSERVSGERHRVLGCGWNHLREGIPGIHGETGAVMNAGRLSGGYREVVVTSSLNPCEFCQRTLMRHLGVGNVRILDTDNLAGNWDVYHEAGVVPVVAKHKKVGRLFREWIEDEANRNTWARDIGNVPKAVKVSTTPIDVSKPTPVRQRAVELAIDLAGRAGGEAPMGAVVLDRYGEVIGAGHAHIAQNDDPSMVAAMSAWRACGARELWRDKTLVLTGGLDQIAYSMFSVFRFGQLLFVGDVVFGEDLVARLKCPVVRLNSRAHRAVGDRLRAWATRDRGRAEEYLGVDFKLSGS